MMFRRGAGASPRHPVRDLRRRLRPRPRPRVARRPPRAPAARRVPRPRSRVLQRVAPSSSCRRGRSALQRAVRPPDQRGVPEERRRLRVEQHGDGVRQLPACGRRPTRRTASSARSPAAAPRASRRASSSPASTRFRCTTRGTATCGRRRARVGSLSVAVRLLGLYSLARLARRFGSGLKGFQQSVRDADFARRAGRRSCSRTTTSSARSSSMLRGSTSLIAAGPMRERRRASRRVRPRRPPRHQPERPAAPPRAA